MEYQHGGDIYSQKIQWDFSANINPLGAPEGVKEAVRRSAENCARYPDSRCRRLVQKLAEHHRIPEKQILCGNGAADLIFQLAFAVKPKQALLPAPSFLEYRQALDAAGCSCSLEFLRREEEFYLDMYRILKRLEKLEREGRKAELLFLCNPNNPTGLAVCRDELRLLAEYTRERNIRLVMDECFLEFLDEPECCSMIPVLDEFPNLVILKAFTKLYGMAGLRLGYVLTSDEELLERMQQVRQPWSVSSTAQAAGEAALEERKYLQETKKIVQAGRKQLYEGLSDLGFWVCPSQANYLFFQDLREGAEDRRLYEACRKRKLLLRSCWNYPGLDGSYYRICVKTEPENEMLLKMLQELLSAGT